MINWSVVEQQCVDQNPLQVIACINWQRKNAAACMVAARQQWQYNAAAH
jgi:hypothetical protein